MKAYVITARCYSDYMDAELEWWIPDPYHPCVKFYANQHNVYVCDNDLERAKNTAIDARSMELAAKYGINIFNIL